MSRAILLAFVVVAVMGLSVCGGASAAPAAGEDLASATGPVAGESMVSGTFATGNEDNWWYVQLLASSQVTLTFGVLPNNEHNCFGSDWNFTDYFGKSLTNGYFIGHGATEQTYEFKYTTPPVPAVATYYVERAPLDGGVGCSYTWSVSPAAAVLTPPPAGPIDTAETEPNDQPGVANGPLLVGQRLTGTISTSNDVDNVYFNGLPNENVTLEMTGHRGCSPTGVTGKITGPFGTGGTVAAGSNNRLDQLFTTAVYGGRYNVAISGQQGCRWQLQATAGVLSPMLVLPLNGGASTIAAAPPVAFGQTHQGGDAPAQYWKVAGIYPGDHLLLSFTNTGDAFSHHLSVGLYPPSVTDLFAAKSKAADSKEISGASTTPLVLRSSFKGTATLFVREVGQIESNLPAFSFVPLVLAHRTTLALGRLPHTARRRRAILTVRVKSLAGVPVGSCVAVKAGTRVQLAKATTTRGSCHLKLRFPKVGRARVKVTYHPAVGWLASSTTSRTVEVTR